MVLAAGPPAVWKALAAPQALEPNPLCGLIQTLACPTPFLRYTSGAGLFSSGSRPRAYLWLTAKVRKEEDRNVLWAGEWEKGNSMLHRSWAAGVVGAVSLASAVPGVSCCPRLPAWPYVE